MGVRESPVSLKISIRLFDASCYKTLFSHYKNHIKANNTIRKIISLFLLFAFLLSISPKQYLHTVFAQHTDVTTNLTKTEVQFNANAYNCDCNQVVCTSPYIPAENQSLSATAGTFASYDDLLIVPGLSQTATQLQLRGPPALI